MDIAGLQLWNEKMRIGLGIIFILFIVCFIAIIIEETFLGGRRRRKAIKAARQRELEGEPNSTTSDHAPQN